MEIAATQGHDRPADGSAIVITIAAADAMPSHAGEVSLVFFFFPFSSFDRTSWGGGGCMINRSPRAREKGGPSE